VFFDANRYSSTALRTHRVAHLVTPSDARANRIGNDDRPRRAASAWMVMDIEGGAFRGRRAEFEDRVSARRRPGWVPLSALKQPRRVAEAV
jgi:hypothetical protein